MILKLCPFSFCIIAEQPDIKPEDLQKIKIPVHVLAGENDLILREHTELIASSIPGSSLEIIPEESHESYIVHSEMLCPILEKYLF